VAGLQQYHGCHQPHGDAEKGGSRYPYLLTAPLAEEVKREPTLRLAFSGGIGISSLECIEPWNPQSLWYAKRVRLAVN
jgi:hypothetical protein